MTAPVVAPSKWKTWIALAGSVLAFLIPLVVSVQDVLPPPWPAIIGAVIAALTALGVYHAPFTPADTVIVSTSVAKSLPPVTGTYKNPWQQ